MLVQRSVVVFLVVVSHEGLRIRISDPPDFEQTSSVKPNMCCWWFPVGFLFGLLVVLFGYIVVSSRSGREKLFSGLDQTTSLGLLL